MARSPRSLPVGRPAWELYEQALRTINLAARGRLLEDVLVRLFQTAQFDVEKDSGAAAPRQTDMVARYGPRVYLVEAKWTKRLAGIAELDELRARMGRATVDATGLLVSVSGFAQGVIEDIRQRRQQPILLVTGTELERVLRGHERLRDLLHRKHDALVLRGDVLVDPATPPLKDPAATFPPPPTRRRQAPKIVTRSGAVLPWLQVKGTFDVWLPALRLPDPDWRWAGLSGSVFTRAALDRGPATVHKVVEEFDRIGWLASGCSWVIRQAGANWFGFDHTTMTAALDTSPFRYKSWGGQPHHTEELAAVGQTLDGGIWLIEAELDGGPPRWATGCEISVVMEGWPLDPEPLRRLMRAVRAEEPQLIRPLTSRVLTRDWTPRDAPVELDVHARIVVTESFSDGPDEEWVVGVVARHPGVPRTALEIEKSPWRAWTSDIDLLPVALRSWHKHDTEERTYELLHAEWSELTRSVPVVLTADWA